MDNMIFLLGLFLLSVANVKAQTLTQTDSLSMETMLHNLPEVMVKGGENGAFPPTRDGCIHSLSMRKRG